MMLWRGPSPCPIGGVEGLGLRCLAFACIYSSFRLICVGNIYERMLLSMNGNSVPAFSVHLKARWPTGPHTHVQASL